MLRGTNALCASNFGFTIPAGATIDGVVVEIEQSAASSVGSPQSAGIYLTADAATQILSSDNKASGALWPTTDAYETYGASSDGWNAGLTASIVNGSGFGVLVQATLTGGKGTNTVRVDHVRVTVYYTAAPPAAPPARGGMGVAISLGL